MKSSFGFRLRTIAGAVVITFIAHETALAAPDMAGLLSFGAKPDIRFKLPQSVAVIEEGYKAPAADKTVILIQDAHTNESGQLNVARALDTILRTENIKHVYLEAGTGDASLSDLRGKAPLEHRKSVALSYLRKGLLQGSEYLDVTSDVDFKLWGVEDPILYGKAVEAYRALVEKRESVSAFLAEMEKTLRFVKSKFLNPGLAEFDARREKYLAGQVPLTEYFETLRSSGLKQGINSNRFSSLKALERTRKLEDAIYFAKAAEEQAQAIAGLSSSDRAEIGELAAKSDSPFKLAAHMGQERKAFYAFLEDRIGDSRRYPELAKYFDYLKAAESIDAKKVLDEFEAFDAEVVSAMAATADEKVLIDSGDHIRVLRNLIEFTASPKDLDLFHERSAQITATAIAGFLNRKLMDLGSNFEKAIFRDKAFEAALLNAEAFYRLTTERDRVFVTNVAEGMERTGEKKAVLITGGYHTPNLKALLRSRGISYVSVTPQVLHPTDHDRYEKLLLSQNLKTGETSRVAAGRRVASAEARAAMLKQMVFQLIYPAFREEITVPGYAPSAAASAPEAGLSLFQKAARFAQSRWADFESRLPVRQGPALVPTAAGSRLVTQEVKGPNAPDHTLEIVKDLFKYQRVGELSLNQTGEFLELHAFERTEYEHYEQASPDAYRLPRSMRDINNDKSPFYFHPTAQQEIRRWMKDHQSTVGGNVPEYTRFPRIRVIFNQTSLRYAQDIDHSRIFYVDGTDNVLYIGEYLLRYLFHPDNAELRDLLLNRQAFEKNVDPAEYNTRLAALDRALQAIYLDRSEAYLREMQATYGQKEKVQMGAETTVMLHVQDAVKITTSRTFVNNTRALEELGIDAVVLPGRADQRHTHDLQEILAYIRFNPRIAGMIPADYFKPKVAEFLDEVTSTADLIGSVDPVYKSNGKLMGDMDLGRSIVAWYQTMLLREQIATPLQNQTVVIVGGGSTGRPAAWAFLNKMKELAGNSPVRGRIVVIERTGQGVAVLQETRDRLPEELRDRFVVLHPVRDRAKMIEAIQNADGVFNVTGLGKEPESLDRAPALPYALAKRGSIWIDANYRPQETLFVIKARAYGSHRGVLVENAVYLTPEINISHLALMLSSTRFGVQSSSQFVQEVRLRDAMRHAWGEGLRDQQIFSQVTMRPARRAIVPVWLSDGVPQEELERADHLGFRPEKTTIHSKILMMREDGKPVKVDGKTIQEEYEATVIQHKGNYAAPSVRVRNLYVLRTAETSASAPADANKFVRSGDDPHHETSDPTLHGKAEAANGGAAMARILERPIRAGEVVFLRSPMYQSEQTADNVIDAANSHLPNLSSPIARESVTAVDDTEERHAGHWSGLQLFEVLQHHGEDEYRVAEVVENGFDAFRRPSRPYPGTAREPENMVMMLERARAFIDRINNEYGDKNVDVVFFGNSMFVAALQILLRPDEFTRDPFIRWNAHLPERARLYRLGGTAPAPAPVTGSRATRENYGDRLMIYPDRKAMGEAAAEYGINKIEELLREKDAITVMFAAAPSQVETVEALVRLSKGRIDWRKVHIVHMDEWVSEDRDQQVKIEDPESFRRWLEDHLVQPLINEHSIPRGELQVHYIPADDLEKSPQQIADEYGELLGRLGVDLVFGGYGNNGHVAFNDPVPNEPKATAALYTTKANAIVVDPDKNPVNQAQQFADYPRFQSRGRVPMAVTVTMPFLDGARYLVMSVPGPAKSQALKNVHSHEGRPENAPFNQEVPATFFNRRFSGTIQVFTDSEGAAMLPGRSVDGPAQVTSGARVITRRAVLEAAAALATGLAADQVLGQAAKLKEKPVVLRHNPDHQNTYVNEAQGVDLLFGWMDLDPAKALPWGGKVTIRLERITDPRDGTKREPLPGKRDITIRFRPQGSKDDNAQINLVAVTTDEDGVAAIDLAKLVPNREIFFLKKDPIGQINVLLGARPFGLKSFPERTARPSAEDLKNGFTYTAEYAKPSGARVESAAAPRAPEDAARTKAAMTGTGTRTQAGLILEKIARDIDRLTLAEIDALVSLPDGEFNVLGRTVVEGAGRYVVQLNALDNDHNGDPIPTVTRTFLVEYDGRNPESTRLTFSQLATVDSDRTQPGTQGAKSLPRQTPGKYTTILARIDTILSLPVGDSDTTQPKANAAKVFSQPSPFMISKILPKIDARADRNPDFARARGEAAEGARASTSPAQAKAFKDNLFGKVFWDPAANRTVDPAVTPIRVGDHPWVSTVAITTPEGRVAPKGLILAPFHEVEIAHSREGAGLIRRTVDTARDILKAIPAAYPGKKLKYVIWPGMGGSIEDKYSAIAAGAMGTKVRFFGLDDVNSETAGEIMTKIFEEEAKDLGYDGLTPENRDEVIKSALQETVVVAQALGMTSVEPVFNVKQFLGPTFDRYGLNRGTHFRKVTIPGSLLDQGLTDADGVRNTVHQLSGQSTAAGRHDFVSNGMLLPLILSGGNPHRWMDALNIDTSDIQQALDLANFIVDSSAEGQNKFVLGLPAEWQARWEEGEWRDASLWIKQHFEESLGKDPSKVMKIVTTREVNPTEFDDTTGKVNDKTILVVKVRGLSNVSDEKIAAFKQKGYKVFVLNLDDNKAAQQGAYSIARVMQIMTYAKYSIAHQWGFTAVNQPPVEFYKRLVSFMRESDASNALVEDLFNNSGYKVEDAQTGISINYTAMIENGSITSQEIQDEMSDLNRVHNLGLSMEKPADVSGVIHRIALRKLGPRAYGEIMYSGNYTRGSEAQAMRTLVQDVAGRDLWGHKGLKRHLDDGKGPGAGHATHAMGKQGQVFTTNILPKKHRDTDPLVAGYETAYQRQNWFANVMALAGYDIVGAKPNVTGHAGMALLMEIPENNAQARANLESYFERVREIALLGEPRVAGARAAQSSRPDVGTARIVDGPRQKAFAERPAGVARFKTETGSRSAPFLLMPLKLFVAGVVVAFSAQLASAHAAEVPIALAGPTPSLIRIQTQKIEKGEPVFNVAAEDNIFEPYSVSLGQARAAASDAARNSAQSEKANVPVNTDADARRLLQVVKDAGVRAVSDLPRELLYGNLPVDLVLDASDLGKLGDPDFLRQADFFAVMTHQFAVSSAGNGSRVIVAGLEAMRPDQSEYLEKLIAGSRGALLDARNTPPQRGRVRVEVSYNDARVSPDGSVHIPRAVVGSKDIPNWGVILRLAKVLGASLVGFLESGKSGVDYSKVKASDIPSGVVSVWARNAADKPDAAGVLETVSGRSRSLFRKYMLNPLTKIVDASIAAYDRMIKLLGRAA